MSAKKHQGGPHPVPPGNQPQGGPGGPGNVTEGNAGAQSDQGAGFQEQDPQRRLGGYATAGEHPIQQPGMLNDGDRHAK